MMEVFGLMTLLGGFSFLGFGLCVANSIEAKDSRVVEGVLAILTLVGALSFVIGVIGFIVLSLN